MRERGKGEGERREGRVREGEGRGGVRKEEEWERMYTHLLIPSPPLHDYNNKQTFFIITILSPSPSSSPP